MGATALINGIYITEAYAGAKIELIADETEEKEFVSFTVIDANGNAVEVFEENGAFYFIMPSSTVTAEALYNTIHYRC